MIAKSSSVSISTYSAMYHRDTSGSGRKIVFFPQFLHRVRRSGITEVVDQGQQSLDAQTIRDDNPGRAVAQGILKLARRPPRIEKNNDFHPARTPPS